MRRTTALLFVFILSIATIVTAQPPADPITFLQRACDDCPTAIVSITPQGRVLDVVETGLAVRALAWSPDGTQLAYTALTDDRSQIFIYTPAERTTAPLSDADADSIAPQWSPDGNLLAYLIRDDDTETYTLSLTNPQFSSPIEGAPGYVVVATDAYPLRWQADGLYFVGAQAEDPPELQRVNVNTGRVTQLTTDLAPSRIVPDAGRVAFVTSATFVLLDPTTDAMVDLLRTPAEEIIAPAWVDERLGFVEARSIRTVDPRDNAVRTLVDDVDTAGFGASPGQNWLAYVRNDNATTATLCLVSILGAQSCIPNANPAPNTIPVWQPPQPIEIVVTPQGAGEVVAQTGTAPPSDACSLTPSTGFMSGANVRTAPSLNAARIGGIPLGDYRVVLGQRGDWFLVQLDASTDGWVSGDVAALVGPCGDLPEADAE